MARTGDGSRFIHRLSAKLNQHSGKLPSIGEDEEDHQIRQVAEQSALLRALQSTFFGNAGLHFPPPHAFGTFQPSDSSLGHKCEVSQRSYGANPTLRQRGRGS